ncbi:MAG: EAL domain-containing protein [Steroidobacteraceae bacterium]|nr:EAL domain-containing protein [Steroidobacteraceae bacterium]
MTRETAGAGLRSARAVAPGDPRVAAALRCACDSHFVQFYEDERFLVETVADWFTEGLRRGAACVAIAIPERLLAIDEALLGRGLDPIELRGSARLRTRDAHDVLDAFTDEQGPDEGRFEAIAEELLRELAAGFPEVLVFGETTALLVRRGLVDQADRVEGFWKRLRARLPFTLYCAYPMVQFAGEANGRFLRDVCDQHAAVIPGESYLGLEDEAARNRYVTGLQQKALALAAETERRKQEQARVRQREERLRLLTELSQDAAWVDRGGRIVEANPRCLEMLGARHEWQVIGRSPLDFIHPDCHEAVRQRIESMLDGLGDVPPCEERLVRLDGRELDVVVSAASFECDGEIAIQVVIRDTSERRAALAAEARAAELARTDAITGLPNRAGFREALSGALAEAGAAGMQLAVLQVDLDRLQLVNDTLGHDAGDEVLRQAARRMARALRDAGSLARAGGDDFLLLAQAPDGEREGRRMAAALAAAFHEPFQIAGRSIFSTPSIGVAVFPRDGSDPAALLRSADLALHAAKRTGGNTAAFYVPSLAADSIARLDLENRLHRALEQDEFRLCYQPVYDVASGQVLGMEALLRWFPREGTAMMPADFIPVAEETGLIQPIGDWVLRTACAQVREWQSRHPALAGLRLAVNVSPRQLRDMDPRASVRRFLEESGLEPTRLTLELTESTFLKDLEPTLRNLDLLRALGVRLSIDDFGTGYSCLAYLRRLPIDEIKIDRSFVHELVRSPNDSALVSAILAMAQALKLDVVAEGVESWDQLEILRSKGCRSVQGYGLGRPMFAEEAALFLQARAARAAGGITAGSFQRA